MQIELEKKLVSFFPFMQARDYLGKKLNFSTPCECDDGWFNLIFELCERLQISLDNESKEFKENFYLIQIKEKYASLRVYPSCINDEIEKIIDLFEIKSIHTCEECGAQGEIRTKYGWKKTLCDEHRNQMSYV